MEVVVGEVEEVAPLAEGVLPEWLAADGAWLARAEDGDVGGACGLVT